MKRSTLALKIAVVLCVGLSTLGVRNSRPTHAQSNQPNTITVNGMGTASGNPDVVSLEVGFEIVNTNLSTAVSKSNDAITAIVQAITKLNVAPADIQAFNVSISPEDRISGGSPTGTFIYRVRNTLRVTLRDATKLQQLISTALDAGADSIGNVNYGISDITSLEQTARALAIKNARDRADELAHGLGVAVGDPVIVSETVIGSNFPASFSTSSSAGLTVQPGRLPDSLSQLTVTVQVQVTYTIATSGNAPSPRPTLTVTPRIAQDTATPTRTPPASALTPIPGTSAATSAAQ